MIKHRKNPGFLRHFFYGNLIVIAVGILIIINLSSLCAAPLRVSSDNPRYFTDSSGKPILLTGSHYWYTIQDGEHRTVILPFDFSSFLDSLKSWNHNFIRLWIWEQTAWAPWSDKKVLFDPSIYVRTGPGKAIDGEPKFDLTKLNQDFFERLRSRVELAQMRGFYVSVMLFQGFSVETKGKRKQDNFYKYLSKICLWLGIRIPCVFRRNPWNGHPYNKANNINEIDGDLDSDGDGDEIHTLNMPEITRLQEIYVRKVIDTLNAYDNVIWEIANEGSKQSTEWQYYFIRFIKEYERTKPKQHPVMMTVQWPDGENDVLFAGPADAISPNAEGGYKDDPPAGDGKKVIICDTDHLWGLGGSHKWVWKCFLRGLNPIFMDPLSLEDYQDHPSSSEWELMRRSMGYINSFASRINLARMLPRGHLTSTRYCLANSGEEYLVYAPSTGEITLDLSLAKGQFFVEWFDPVSGTSLSKGLVTGGGRKVFRPPFNNDAVLYLFRSKNNGFEGQE